MYARPAGAASPPRRSAPRPAIPAISQPTPCRRAKRRVLAAGRRSRRRCSPGTRPARHHPPPGPRGRAFEGSRGHPSDGPPCRGASMTAREIAARLAEQMPALCHEHCAAVPGTSIRGTCAPPTATGTPPETATSTTGSALPGGVDHHRQGGVERDQPGVDHHQQGGAGGAGGGADRDLVDAFGGDRFPRPPAPVVGARQ